MEQDRLQSEQKELLEEIREKVDRLAELSAQQESMKREADAIKAWFEANATDALKDSKEKTVEYWGSRNAKVTVGMSSTVKPVSFTMVKNLLGTVYPDFVKEEVSYKMTEPCKRLFTMMFLGEYTEGSLDETIRGITGDEKIQRVLRKKLKGKYGKDTETLVKLAGLSRQEAGDWAYLVAEVINWEWIVQILKAAIDIINNAVIVDEGLKVTVEAEKKG